MNNTKPPPSPPTKFPTPHTLTTLHWVSAPPSSIITLSSTTTTTTAYKSRPKCPFRKKATGNHPLTTTTTTINQPPASQDQILLTLLRQRKTDEAWLVYVQSPHIPCPTCLSRLVAQLSHQNTPNSLTRAQSIIQRLRDERQLNRLNPKSLGLVVVAAAKAGHSLYAASVVKSMLKSGYIPHVKAYSAAMSRLATTGDNGPTEALKIFNSVVRRVRLHTDLKVVTQSGPDTGAYNAVLSACANMGDTNKFLQLFDEMPEFGCEPDVLTYNVMIKLCERAGRKDLFVFVLERILEKQIPFCETTLHSLAAAYVGLGDLETPEKMVQAMKEGRRDICKVLKDSTFENPIRFESDVFDKLLPNSINPSDHELPLFPKLCSPDSRMYTILMKGYMNQGRVTDTVRMLEAMRHEEDSACHPNNVSYTTAVSALVKVGSMDRALEVLTEMNRIGVYANRITYNIFLKGYCQQLQLDKAKEVMKEMTETGIEPDVVSYNTLINGCILVNDSAGAFSYFSEMRARGIAPDKISYTTLMKAFALSVQSQLANKVFDKMLKDPSVKIDVVAWNMLVQEYCKLGLVEEAKKIVQRMKERGFYPDVCTYGSLANGISIARKPGEALLLWNEVKERCDAETDSSLLSHG